jgi:hypothetical protein
MPDRLATIEQSSRPTLTSSALNAPDWLTATPDRRTTSTSGYVDAVLGQMRPVGLDDIAAASLMQRVDHKFIASPEDLVAFLAPLVEEYDVLAVQDRRAQHYRTVYFDTPSFELYHQHRVGRAGRLKVRNREYVESALCFTELKRKTKRDRTVKQREPVPQVTDIPAGHTAGIRHDLERLGCLSPTLLTEFTRVTLVRLDRRERMTLDFDLRLVGPAGSADLARVCVIEVKQERPDRRSPAMQEARHLHLHPGFSKYALGVALLYAGVRRNQFKRVLRQVDDVMGKAS